MAIVGAGYTGLWTAYYLAKARPSSHPRHRRAFRRLRRLGTQRRLADEHHHRRPGRLREAVLGVTRSRRFQHILNDTVDEVIRVAEAEGIDAEIHKGGSLLVARNRAQLGRLAQLARARRAVAGGGVPHPLAGEANDRISVAGSLGGAWQPHCARIHPAKLAAGTGAGGALARGGDPRGDAGLRFGRARRSRTGASSTARHVHARHRGVHRESSAGEKRTWVPLNSSMVITEPAPAGGLGRDRLGQL